MPSSLIFAGLVVVWLLILVPAVARRQQEVARLSPAALSGRVLERPGQRRQTQEVGQVDQAEDPRPVATQPDRAEQTARVPAARTAAAHTGGNRAAGARVPVGARAGSGRADVQGSDRPEDDDHLPTDADERHWERPPARYRPGRGGFDPEAAALAARARYATRQHIVLGLIALAGIAALVAGIALPALWWLHVLIDIALVGYLVYLRRQVRMEEAIRARRAARMAGTHRPPAADDPELDDWARRGADTGHAQGEVEAPAETTDKADLEAEDPAEDEAEDRDEDHDEHWAGDAADPNRVRGTGEPLGVLPARRRTVKTARDDEDGADLDDAADADPEPALPLLQPAPPPPLPAGTTLVEDDEEDAELSALDAPARPDYRRAAGE